jgi:predicted nucleic acid-binding protein
VIVVDASAIAEVLLRRPFAPAIEAVIADSDLRVPEHFRIEAISVLRRLGLRGEISDKAAARALRVLSHLRAPAYPTTLLQDRIWALRHRLPPTTPPTSRSRSASTRRCSPSTPAWRRPRATTAGWSRSPEPRPAWAGSVRRP